MTSTAKASDIDRKFDDGEEVMGYFDMSRAITEDAPAANRKVNLTMPEWLISRLDSESANLAISRNALINVWLAERINNEDRQRTIAR